MDKELPTAEEQIKEFKNGFDGLAFQNEAEISITKFLMIEFAKLRVEQALKEASEKALTAWATTDFYDNNKVISKNSILKSYPLTNIK